MSGKELKDIRERYNMTQKEFAEKVGVSTILISFAETNRRGISKKLAQKIAESFNIKITFTFK